MDIVGDRIGLIGNVHSQDILLRMTSEQVYDQCMRQLSAGARSKKFVLGVRAGFAPETPRENARAMIQAGMAEINIEPSGICTRCHTDDFFSYRAARTTGRFAAVIGLTERKS